MFQDVFVPGLPGPDPAAAGLGEEADEQQPAPHPVDRKAGMKHRRGR